MIKRSRKSTKGRSGTDLFQLNEEIRTQNEEYFEIYDKIAKKVPKLDRIAILNANKQFVPASESQVRERQTTIEENHEF